MSSHGPEEGDTCEFGHTFVVHDEEDNGDPGAAPELKKQIEEGDIGSLSELKQELGTDLLKPVLGDPYKHLEVGSGSQGLPHMFILDASDRFDDDWDWDVDKTEEKIFVSPQSNLHAEFMQRQQQAEQNIKNTMQNLSQLKKQKHMLEHDIRKLRSRAEAMRTGDEIQIKADFVELVDGAGGGQQGGDEAALKFFRDQNIYPSIVADFNEMDSVEDLEEGGKLAELPENEKAVLKKKYTMYEKWKDLYGSEVQRKLNDIKSQLHSIERSIKETEQWLEPYARDLVMIHQKDRNDLHEDLNRHWTFRGHSSQYKQFEFIAHQGFRKHHGELEECDDEDATHFKIIYLFALHINIAGSENPNSPAEGPTVGVVMIHPAIVCRHIFQNIFQEKIEKSQKRLDQLVSDYTGDFETKDGNKLRDALTEKDMSVRKLREKVDEKVDGSVPIEFSASLRQLEYGLDSPDVIKEDYGKEYLEAMDEILGTDYATEEGDDSGEPLTGINKTLKSFTGNYDIYHLEDPDGLMGDLRNDLKFSYYYDMKLSLGLYTMK